MKKRKSLAILGVLCMALIGTAFAIVFWSHTYHGNVTVVGNIEAMLYDENKTNQITDITFSTMTYFDSTSQPMVLEITNTKTNRNVNLTVSCVLPDKWTGFFIVNAIPYDLNATTVINCGFTRITDVPILIDLTYTGELLAEGSYGLDFEFSLSQ